jgi:hypothetical protein
MGPSLADPDVFDGTKTDPDPQTGKPSPANHTGTVANRPPSTLALEGSSLKVVFTDTPTSTLPIVHQLRPAASEKVMSFHLEGRRIETDWR